MYLNAKPLLRRFKYLFIAWTTIIFFVLMQMILLGFYDQEKKWIFSDYLIYSLIQMSIGSILILFYVIPIYDKIISLKSFLLKMSLIIIHAFGFGVLYIISLSLTYELKLSGTITARLLERASDLFFTDLHNSIKTYLIFISILYAYDIFKTNTQTILEKQKMKNEIDKLKLHSLLAQLQPHFLFNALNNSVALIDENKLKAQKLLIQLSELLRYSIRLEPSKLVTIQEEINTSKIYLAIEETKYESKLRVIWEIKDNQQEFFIPPLTLQPILENAIKHGFVNNNSDLTIIIKIEPNLIEIRNNGSPYQDNLIVGSGLELVKKRLNLHFKNDFYFKIYQDGEWVINLIKINAQH